eukprot:TRINITY_DN30136_c0_g1_i2.p1 TRINITY_DN30136_c0_g1~~TRINITY_DN30136_c0_g1_i2.p1  ORF type:complete len:553 (-),score=89.40 TRINITY_DN30136_c0_g1_i2:257-1915(-)
MFAGSRDSCTSRLSSTGRGVCEELLGRRFLEKTEERLGRRCSVGGEEEDFASCFGSDSEFEDEFFDAGLVKKTQSGAMRAVSSGARVPGAPEAPLQHFALHDSSGDEDAEDDGSFDICDAFEFDKERLTSLISFGASNEELTTAFEDAMAGMLLHHAVGGDTPEVTSPPTRMSLSDKKLEDLMTPPTSPSGGTQHLPEQPSWNRRSQGRRRSSLSASGPARDAAEKAKKRERASLITKAAQAIEGCEDNDALQRIREAVESARRRKLWNIAQAAELLEMAVAAEGCEASCFRWDDGLQRVQKAIEAAKRRHRKSVSRVVHQMDARAAEGDSPRKPGSRTVTDPEAGASVPTTPFNVEEKIQLAVQATYKRRREDNSSNGTSPAYEAEFSSPSRFAKWDTAVNVTSVAASAGCSPQGQHHGWDTTPSNTSVPAGAEANSDITAVHEGPPSDGMKFECYGDDPQLHDQNYPGLLLQAPTVHAPIVHSPVRKPYGNACGISLPQTTSVHGVGGATLGLDSNSIATANPLQINLSCVRGAPPQRAPQRQTSLKQFQ